jgi:hypothetical protein
MLKRLKRLKSVKISIFENIFIYSYSKFNFKNNLFSTLEDRMEIKLEKADFTLNVYVIIFLKIRQGRKNK